MTMDPAIIRSAAHPLVGRAEDLDPLLAMIGDARFVLIGEASHGTHEFYAMRAAITRRLIIEKGFTAVAVEADWPDAYQVNRFVRCDPAVPDAERALSGFGRFPTWMWRNTVVSAFIEWMRAHNASIARVRERCGFYGIDLYSLFGSIEAVLRYLDRVDPDAARRARSRYACFDHFERDAQRYGMSAAFDLTAQCEDEVVEQLVELQRAQTSFQSRDGIVAADEYFFAEQNARLVLNAERYYRTMFHGRTSSWNLRDEHMSESLEELVEHLSETGRNARVVVWAHNSHLGDARATRMGAEGELNLGQLTRELHGDDAVLVGFTTYDGSVTAAHEWDEPARLRAVRPGLASSYESLFHSLGIPSFFLNLRDDAALSATLRGPLLERAIGVIYRPETERHSHYFDARLTEQFDAVFHIDRTHALRPLERWPIMETEEPPETYPFGL
jgi:erythromycin esterase-like protein